jgi:hypothetical protein
MSGASGSAFGGGSSGPGGPWGAENIPVRADEYLRASEVRAIESLVRENEDVHFQQVVKEVERLVRATASMEPESKYVVYEVPFFSASLTSFTMEYDAFVVRLVTHFRRQGFCAYAVDREPGRKPRSKPRSRQRSHQVLMYVSWRASTGRP